MFCLSAVSTSLGGISYSMVAFGKYFTLSKNGTLKCRPGSSVVEMILESRTVQPYSFSSTVYMELKRHTAASISMAKRITVFFFIGYSSPFSGAVVVTSPCVKLSSGSTFCTPFSPEVSIYTFTSGRASEMAS